MLRLIQALIVGRPSTDSSVQVCGFLGGWWLINGCEPPLCCPSASPFASACCSAWLASLPLAFLPACLHASVRPWSSRLIDWLLAALLAGC